VPVKRVLEDERFFEVGVGFDGSSVRGFKKIDESDMIYFPDPKAYYILPWTNGENKTAVIIGDIKEPFGKKEVSEVDPRGYVAKKVLKEAESMGFHPTFGPEIEFFVFKSVDPTRLVYDLFLSPNGGVGDSWGPPRVMPKSPEMEIGGYIIRPKEGYFRNAPIDTTEEFRNDACKNLIEMGFKIELHHHEVATNGQVELNFSYGDLISTADKVQIYKMTCRNIAKLHGLIATFMPKPIYLDNGSGMHINNALFKGNENIFYDENDEYVELSQTARYYIGGLLDHARAMTAICAPTINSYKRLVPGFEAPINIMKNTGSVKLNTEIIRTTPVIINPNNILILDI